MAPTNPPATPPDSFITTESSGTAWDINITSGAWKAILADNVLSLQSASPSGNTIALSCGHFWTLQFSSASNKAIFNDSNSPVVTYAQPTSTSATQPVQGAVLGMVTSPPPPSPLDAAIPFADVAAKFNITASNSPALLTSFLTEINSAALRLQLDVSPSTKNALWTVPAAIYQVVVSLTFDIKAGGSAADLQNFLSQQFGLNLSLGSNLPKVIFTSFTSYKSTDWMNSSDLSVSSSYSLIFSFKISNFDASVVFTPTDVSLSVTESAVSNTPVYQNLSNAGLTSSSKSGTSTSLASSAIPSAGDKFLKGIQLWNLTIGFDVVPSNSSSSPAQATNDPVFWSVGLIGTAAVGSGSKAQELSVAITYDSRISSFLGRLITASNASTSNTARLYDYQNWTYLPPATPVSTLSITDLIGLNKPPPEVPQTIHDGSIAYQSNQSGGGFTFALSVDIGNNPNNTPSTTPNPAPSSFDWSSIYVNIILQNDGTTTSTAIQVFSHTALAAPTTPSSSAGVTFAPAINLDLEFVSDQFWTLEASANDIQISQLANYFESGLVSHISSTVASLTLKSVDIVYTFSNTGDASSFLFTAALVLGELELDLYYQYVSPLLTSASSGQTSAAAMVWNGSPPSQVSTTLDGSAGSPTWIFEAFLGSASPKSTIQSVVSSISPGTNLPDFVGKIPVNPANGGDSPGKLKLIPLSPTPPTGLLLIVQIVLADLDFTFVLLSPASSSGSKMAFRISVDQIPLINSIPLIKQLPQPFDSLLYLFVSDDSGTGLTQSDLDTINPQLDSLHIPRIQAKENNSSNSDTTGVIQTGHHFMVIQQSKVVLDHNFNNGTEPAASPSGDTSNAMAIRQLDASSSNNANTGSEPAPTKGNLDVQLPFLSISAVTLQFKQQSLYLDFDATMMLGPITFTLIGFEIVLNLSKVQLNDLSKLLSDGAISFGIHGMDLSINESPLDIAGVFIHNKATDGNMTVEEYAGGVAIGFEEWQFVAVGAYELITFTSPQGSYKSVFVYAKLDGPLVSLAFATIEGVRLGFGYNSNVRFPTMAEMPQFPFLDGSAEADADNDPLKILNSLVGSSGGNQPWVSPKEDSYWGAVGLTLTAFGILSITAVLMLEFQDSGVIIAVLADGIAQMPPDVKDPDETLFYVEIYMIAELNTVQGFFTVQASLAPSSHILVSSCRLTGGFALYNWFNPNTHSGDFVFTVGGYHPAYTPPSWYPPVARLGISFTLGDMINVLGVVYFAITPKCVMGGGALDLTLDVGPVSAWLKIFLDVFIQFKPFYYTADLSVSVGCAISINVWFVHVRISVSVGASLYIQGPNPFGGTANVDFYLFSFTIHFGGQNPGPPPAILTEFYAMVLTPGPPSAQGSPPAVAGDPSPNYHKYVLTSGIYQSPSPPPASTATSSTGSQFPDSGPSTPWNTKAGTFGCTIGCDFAVSTATINNDSSNSNTTAILPPDGSAGPPAFFSKPMHISSPILSTLSVTVWTLDTNGTKLSVVPNFGGVMVMKDVPTAVWGSYESSADPATPNTPTPSALTDPSTPTMNLCMGVSLTPPVPLLKKSAIQEFDATAAFVWPLGSWPLPALVPKQDILLASGIEYPTDASSDRWTKVGTDWTTFGNAGSPILGGTVTAGVQAPGLLQMAAQSLGWNQPPPSGNPNSPALPDQTAAAVIPPWMLNGEVPDLLIENLGTQYGVLPRYSATGTAA